MKKYSQVVMSALGVEGEECRVKSSRGPGGAALARRGKMGTVQQREQPIQRLGGWTEFNVTGIARRPQWVERVWAWGPLGGEFRLPCGEQCWVVLPYPGSS